MAAEAQRRVDVPADEIFAVLADAHGYARWVCGTREVRAADPAWPQPGSRLWHRFGRWPLRATGSTEVLACEAPRRLVLWADALPLALVHATITLSDDDGGCVVRIREDMIDGRLRRLGPATAAAQRLRNRRSLSSLADLAVRAAPPGR